MYITTRNYHSVSWSDVYNTEEGQDVTTEPEYIITGLSLDTEYDVCVVSSSGEEDANEVCDKGTTVNSSEYEDY